jgi:DNA-binding NarL/FixJ family response regulator
VLAARLAELIQRLPDMDLIAVVDNEAEALRRIADSRPDAVILDLNRPQGSGYGVLRALAGASPRPRFIVLTNYELPEYQREAESFGAAAFLDRSRDLHRLPSLLLALSREHSDANTRD